MFPGKTFFVGFKLTAFKNKHTFLFCIQCNAKLDTFHVIYLVVTKEMTQICHLCHELLKSDTARNFTWAY